MKTASNETSFPRVEMMIPNAKAAALHGYALAQHIKRTSHDLLQIEEGRSIQRSAAS